MIHSNAHRPIVVAAICLISVGCASTTSTRMNHKPIRPPIMFDNVIIDEEVVFNGEYEVITHTPAIEQTGLFALAVWAATEGRRQEEKKEWENKVRDAANNAFGRHLRETLAEHIRLSVDVDLGQPETAEGVFRISVLRYGQRFEKGFWKHYISLFAEIRIALYHHKGGLTESYQNPVWEHRFDLSDKDRTSLPHESGLRPSRMQRDLVEKVFRNTNSIDRTFRAMSRLLLDSAF